ncbi:phosphoribosyl-ATP diphosphatase [Methylophilaceae bacterium]|jgi:phosphoribosyl-ATP pyrophosphohydrolase|nr:phosphoribosyl-ATP diphosphatase [Methylophilaceae bacterium]NCV28268.1 phosphoribosyl-ATP diphosphatase [Nitrosomonadales bacterium]NCV37906.1 phosphoribosyl-ATP diphosphatase [Betaproteobacteria bacterium]MDA9914171.1 phosphoribosyl-ATP diphosphatase [Methylophilaceae bacterium]MDC0626869.1 phosphoribosyl-ATP diphosphatase [Methylophilaceae bacterium]
MSELEQLQQLIQSKKDSDPSLSYTAKLFSQGIEEIQKKFGEESIELIIASNQNNRNNIINETADVLYHLLVLLSEKSISLKEVVEELERRSSMSGLEEKANRSK